MGDLMKRLLPFVVFLAGAVLLSLAVTRLVNRGPFERAVVGTEAIYWSAAEQTGAGYDPGPVDGLFGDRTAAAIRAFERDAELPVTGQPSETILAVG